MPKKGNQMYHYVQSVKKALLAKGLDEANAVQILIYKEIEVCNAFARGLTAEAIAKSLT